MGTFAGLLYGAHLTGMIEQGTRVVGVRVTPRLIVNGWMVRRQMESTYRYLCSKSEQFAREVPREFPKVLIDHRQNGRGYGHATESGVEAFHLAAEDGFEAELTYTGKTLAGMIARLREDPNATCLLWVTNHTGDLSPYWRGIDYHELPEQFHDVYEGELEYSWSELLGRPW
jgi:1-aminocyclopropane-1-carboxylate deaminase/D-cysteine desulfhydrase-like pyridoxal-dependent ACC family enzyme